jgi:rhodanese-related sulfurtransferase
MKICRHVVLMALLIGTLFVVECQELGASHTDIPEVLRSYNTSSVPYLKVQTLQKNYQDYVILDTRKKEEYAISHLPKAIWAGDKYDLEKIKGVDKNVKIVVYCSLGIRSEDYGEQMLQEGFTKVYNLYGSIFYWKDAGYQLVDHNNKPTQRVHVYGRKWAKYLKTGEKVF